MPTDVSPELQKAIATPYGSPAWDLNPKTPEGWKQEVGKLAAATVPPLREKLGVTSHETTIGGVHAFIVQPKEIPAENRNRLLFHIHVGGYVYNPSVAGTQEAVLMAGYGGRTSLPCPQIRRSSGSTSRRASRERQRQRGRAGAGKLAMLRVECDKCGRMTSMIRPRNSASA